MEAAHHYEVTVAWTGNRGTGTSGYRDYDRSHTVTAAGPAAIEGSSDPAFRGDASRWNPEQLLVAALSECHLLAYLHCAAVAGVVVVDYTDTAVATMIMHRDGGGQFTTATLRPRVTVTTPDMVDKALSLHDDAHRQCMIAASVNFPVGHEPEIVTEAG